MIAVENETGARSKAEITCWLRNWQAGDEHARELLIAAVYDELKRIARFHLKRERANHTLQPTELVNEAFIRLVEQKNISWEDRVHFLGITARLMRQILIEYMRRKTAQKRGGMERELMLDEIQEIEVNNRPLDLIRLDDALDELEKVDPKKSRLVELRYFAGLTLEETAAVLKVSLAQVKREWLLAKAWLFRHMSEQVK